MPAEWPIEDTNFPGGKTFPPLFVKRGTKIVIIVLRVDDYLNIKFDGQIRFQSGNYAGPARLVDLTQYTPTPHVLESVIEIIPTDYGAGGDNWWTLQAAILLNDEPDLYSPVNIHYQRLNQKDLHLDAVYSTKIIWND